MFSPKPRYRFYGTPGVYTGAARHALCRAFGQRTDHVAAVEARVAAMIGAAHAIAVPQARFGIYLVVRQLATQDRPKVVMSPYTIHDVVNMVLCAGGRPVFADIDPVTCNIDPDQVESLIDDATGAVMITHLHGLACDVERLKAICDAKGVPMIEDAAQAFGARVAGKPLGGFGRAGIFSFGRAKNINAFYGGMVVTDDPDLAAAIRAEIAALPEEDTKKLFKRIVHCGIGDLITLPPVYSTLTFRIFRYGAVHGVESVNKVVQTENNPVRKETLPPAYRRRLTQMQARLILEQLDQVEANNAIRLRHARIYQEGLAGLPGIGLPPWREDGSHLYLQYPVQVPDRWSYVRYMMGRGRDLAIQHMTTAADLPIFADLARDCPAARFTAERVVLLPTYPRYGDDEVAANVAATIAYLRLAPVSAS